ncbi:MAG: hypothetical protein IJW06_01350 [Clostridia bacterium]|nr:hypothetical protein [Clostridia bacterium]
MTNNWKYASLGQRERLKMIRGGDEDVYNTEKERNNYLRKLQAELGVPTTDIDDWDATIDNAYSNATLQKADKSGLPKISSGKYNKVNKAYSDYMKALNAQKKEELEEATAESESAYEYLVEWLANNGFSAEGMTAKQEKKALEESVAKFIEQIKEKYKEYASDAKESLFGPYLR